MNIAMKISLISACVVVGVLVLSLFLVNAILPALADEFDLGDWVGTLMEIIDDCSMIIMSVSMLIFIISYVISLIQG